MYGCLDSTQFNYNPLANTNYGSCIAIVSGCTEPTASNYDPLANVEDGSCQYVLGCTDPLALNYDPIATQDNGSCSYCNYLAMTHKIPSQKAHLIYAASEIKNEIGKIQEQ